MEKLKLNLSPIGGIKFQIYADKYGEEESLLPFSDGDEDSNLFTVLNALNTFSIKYKHRQGNDKDWMVREGILCEDRRFFHENMRENIGQKLYDALFPDKIKDTLNQKLGRAGPEKDLHLQIQYDGDTIKESRLSLYPWQLVNNGQDFLAKRRVIFSYLIAHRNSLATGKRKVSQIKVLLISSSASEKDNQKLKNKELIIRNGLKKAEQEGQACLLNWYELSQEKPTYKRLSDYLIDNINEKETLPDIIHFDGHGVFKKQCKNLYCPENGSNKIFYPTHRKRCTYCKTPLNKPEGFLLFEDDEGKPDYISAERFTNLVLIRKPVLVVITACKSALAHQGESVFNGIAQSILREVPAVVATPFNISEDSTTNFVEQFYRALGAKQSLLKAVKLASQAMRHYDYEWYRPIIFLRHDGNEDGYLFEFVDSELNIDSPKQDWGDSPAVDVFFGRSEELNTLEKWIVEDNCRLVTIVGMGGIGKTDLSLKLAKKIQNEFEYIIWKSLRTAPSVEDILIDLIKFLSNQQDFNLPNNLEDKISLLLQYLQAKRCLLILDNAEVILEGGERAGQYLRGHEGYGEMFRQVGQREHQSCLLLTSRETPQDISQLEGEKRPVRILPLSGLEESAARQIFITIGSFSGSDEEWTRIIKFYDGNPLALEIVARYIRNHSSGNLSEFIKENTPIVGNLQELLNWHFQRFSSEEKEVMYWLAINQEPISNLELRDDILSQESKKNIPETLQLLEKRLPIERSTNACLTLQPVLIEYMTERLVEEICQEIKTGKISLLKSHALLKAQAADYVRETQKRLILKPLVDQFEDSDIYIEDQLDKILANLPKPRQSQRKPKTPKPSYAAGNILNLFCYLGIDLTGYDFSNLAVWQADLQGMSLHYVNFSYCNFNKCFFTQNFRSILSVVFSPNGKFFATGDSKGEVRLWQVADGKTLWNRREHIDWVWSVAFSHDGKLIASSSDDRVVKLWNARTGECIHTLKGHTDGVWSVTFSRDGQTLASSSGDYTVRLWNINTGELLRNLHGQTDRVRSIAFSPDGQILAGGCINRDIKLWKVRDGQCIKYLQGHTDRVWSVTFSRDGQTLASSGDDKTVRVWNINTGELLWSSQEHHNWVRTIAFSPDGKVIVSGSEDQTVRLWNAHSGKCIKVFQGHTNRVWSVAYSPDGQTLISGGDDQTIKLWNTNNGQCIKSLQGYTNVTWSVTFSPDGQTLASSSEDKIVRVWDTQSGKCLQELEGHLNWVRCVAFSHDGKLIVSGGDDQVVKLWNARTGECIHTLKGHTNKVWSVTFSLNDQTLASSSDDYTIRLWNTYTGECIRIIQNHTNRVCSVTFSPDGQTLASSGDDKTVRVWNIRTGECIQELEGHLNLVWSVAFSPNGKLLASSSDDETVKLWDISTGKCLKSFQGHKKGVLSVAFNPDALQIASSSEDEMIKLWDVKTGKCLNTLKVPRPYDGMLIREIKGLNDSQKDTLKTLGAIEETPDNKK